MRKIKEDIKIGDYVIMENAGGWSYHPVNNGCIATVSSLSKRTIHGKTELCIGGKLLNPRNERYTEFGAVPIMASDVRKATKEEINNFLNMKKLNRTDFKRIYDIACNVWKPKLAEKFKNFAVKDELEVEADFYAEMRKACTNEQNKLFDEIFGKDEIDNLKIPKTINKKSFDEALSNLCKCISGDKDVCIERIAGAATEEQHIDRGLFLRGTWKITKTLGGYEAIPLIEEEE